MKSKSGKSIWRESRNTALILTLLWNGLGSVHALEITTDNPDIQMTWGNTVRYNIGERMQSRNDMIGNGLSFQEGDYAYNRGDVVTNRLDLLSEFDFAFQKRLGFRVSAAAWYDAAYHNDVKTNPAFAARNTYSSGNYSDYVKRYYQGPSGEFLDVYGFANFKLGNMPGTVKVGRYAELWGEALALSTHSVSYAQAPSDLRKALATPGVDAKETALPIGQVSTTLQVAPTLALSAQYLSEWKPTRVPEGGTYLAAVDAFLYGSDRTFIAAPTGAIVPFALTNKGVLEPGNGGEWGVNARWSPEWLDGTMGFYYREFDERLPWLKLTVAPGGSYQAVYAKGAKLYGVTLSKQLGGVSLGAELLRRENTAMNSTITNGAAEGTRGDTWHALFNGVAVLGTTPIWSSASLTGELAYSRWDKVRTQQALFNDCAALNKDTNSGCSTKDNWQMLVRFAPTWTAVWPGWDIGTSAALMYGIKGNSAVLNGGNEGAGNYSLGMTFTYNAQHDFTIAYNGYLAQIKAGPSPAAPIANGLTSQLQDRGWLSLTYKGSF